ncbi:hypothetical protein ACH4E7_43490 [Kitasatospora sp. NPDC018058]|uniref:hypothetical protein n=1 Tax=Kitasatospora sp. NPDC018058 TaxID=3364025 RepID=UPI0037C107E9
MKELQQLTREIADGRWSPSRGDSEIAREIIESAISEGSIHAAISNRADSSAFTRALRRVEAVLSLPPVHEEPTARAALVSALYELLRAVSHPTA